MRSVLCKRKLKKKAKHPKPKVKVHLRPRLAHSRCWERAVRLLPGLDLRLLLPGAGPPSASSSGLDLRCLLPGAGPPSASALGWAQLWGQRGTSGPGKQGMIQGAVPLRGPAGCQEAEKPPSLGQRGSRVRPRGAGRSGRWVFGATSLLRTQGTFPLPPRTRLDQTLTTAFTRGTRHRQNRKGFTVSSAGFFLSDAYF